MCFSGIEPRSFVDEPPWSCSWLRYFVVYVEKGRALDAEFLHSPAKGVSVKIKDAGCKRKHRPLVKVNCGANLHRTRFLSTTSFTENRTVESVGATVATLRNTSSRPLLLPTISSKSCSCRISSWRYTFSASSFFCNSCICCSAACNWFSALCRFYPLSTRTR